MAELQNPIYVQVRVVPEKAERVAAAQEACLASLETVQHNLTELRAAVQDLEFAVHQVAMDPESGGPSA